jgi:hypothetical protein
LPSPVRIGFLRVEDFLASLQDGYLVKSIMHIYVRALVCNGNVPAVIKGR